MGTNFGGLDVVPLLGAISTISYEVCALSCWPKRGYLMRFPRANGKCNRAGTYVCRY